MNLDYVKICRLCLKDGILESIFDDPDLSDSSATTIPQMIESFVSFSVRVDDGLPSKICTKCNIKLEATYAFKKQCEDSHTILMGNKNIKQEAAEETLDVRFDVTNNLELKLEEPDEDWESNNYRTDLDDNNISSDDVPIGELVKGFKSTDEKKLKKQIKKPEKVKKLTKTQEILGINVKELKTESGTYQCNQCPRKINCRRAFVRHLEKHLGIKSFFCTICQKYYARKSVHMQTHTRPKIKRFQCDKCNKGFFQKGALNVHLVMHSDERPHVCEDCGKGFKRMARLLIHKKIHSTVKEYMCQYCSKEFCTMKTLLSHIKYKHTKERNYQCPKCDKRFVTGHCLKIHERRHLGIKKYNCEFCDKTFVSKSGLITHRLMHTKEKPHACRVCYVKFGRTDHRNRHEMTAHGVDFRQNKTPEYATDSN